MQIDDQVVFRYFELLSSRSAADLAELKAKTTDGRVTKRLFGEEMVTRYHGADAAREAMEAFDRVYMNDTGLPDHIPEHTVQTDGDTLWIAKALAAAKLCGSTNDGKRMVTDGWVEVDGARVTDAKLGLPKGKRYLLRTGSKNRKFAYVTVA